MTISDTPRNRSYSKHDELAEIIGAKPHAHGYRPNVYARLRTGSVVQILSTSNAGFNGIEAYVELACGKRRHISLGEVVEWVTCEACDTVATEWGDDGGLYCSEHVGMGGTSDDIECGSCHTLNDRSALVAREHVRCTYCGRELPELVR